MRRRFRLMVGADAARREVERELRSHLEQYSEELIRSGMTESEARRSAESSFGDYSQIAAECTTIREDRNRDRRRRDVLDAVKQDIRYSVRLLRRTPSFTLTALVTLALGIGATTGLFSVVYALLIRPLPFPDDERLLDVGEADVASGEAGIGLSIPLGEELSGASTLAAGGIYYGLNLTVRLAGELQQTPAVLMSPGAFEALGVAPAIGRVPTGEDGGVVVSDGFWRRHYGGVDDITGFRIEQAQGTLVVIGVMPEGFVFPDQQTDIWLPYTQPDPRLMNRSVHAVRYVARRRSDASGEDVRAELQRIHDNGQQSAPGSDSGHVISVIPLRTWLVGDSGAPVVILFVAVALVLLVASANLAGLQLARLSARSRELAVRAALGAGRWAVIRQLTIESFVLGLTGCVAGALLAPLVQAFIVAAYPGGLPLETQIRYDTGALLFAAGAGMTVALLSGLLPALQTMRARRGSELQAGLTRSTDGAGRQRARRALIVAEVAVAVVLTIGGALVARSFARVSMKPMGFDADGLMMMTVSVSHERRTDDNIIRLYQSLPERIADVPGVVAVSGASTLPITGGDSRGNLTVEGQANAAGSGAPTSYRRVLPHYFNTMGIRVVAGRDFDARDDGREPFVVIVNESLATRYFGTPANALGKRIKVGVPENEPWLSVVGVAADVRNEKLEAVDEHATYEPHPQRPWRTMQLVVRTAGDPLAVSAAVANAARAVDPNILIVSTGTMRDRIADSLAPRRFNMQLLVGFALLALFLAALGIHGITSHVVNERRRELGIRIAVGASSAQILRLVIGQSARLAVLGAILGMMASIALIRIVRAMLFEVTPTDPPALAATALLLAAVTLAAAYIPARRAARTDPSAVLRDY